MWRISCVVLIALLVVPCISNAGTIDVQIKGVDDGIKSTIQKDYREAVLFAKREAIERAGVKIKSMTTIKDFVLNADYIESQAEAVLLPGYNILDIGYQQDGTYLVILVGKIQAGDDEPIEVDKSCFLIFDPPSTDWQRTVAKSLRGQPLFLDGKEILRVDDSTGYVIWVTTGRHVIKLGVAENPTRKMALRFIEDNGYSLYWARGGCRVNIKLPGEDSYLCSTGNLDQGKLHSLLRIFEEYGHKVVEIR